MTHEQIKSIKVMRLQPGDVLVIKVKDRLSLQQHEGLQGALSHIIPTGAKCMILDGGMDIDVLRATDATSIA